jgi:AsmA protein
VAGRHIIPDERLLLPPRLDLDLDLTANELVARGAAFGAFSTHLVAAHGRLALDPIEVTPQGGAPAQAALHYGAATAPSSLSLRGPSVPLAPLLALFALPPVASGLADVTAALSARGDSPHALAASLNGTLALRMSGGTLDAAVLAPLVAHAHLPLATPQGAEPLRCLAVGASVREGHAAVDPLVADAGRLAVSGTGDVDLGDETLDLHLLPLLRLGPMLTIPLRVTGGWRDPAIASDAGVRGRERADPCEIAGIAAPPLARIKPPKAADILRGLLRR